MDDGLFYRSYCANFDNFTQAVKSEGKFCTKISSSDVFSKWMINQTLYDQRIDELLAPVLEEAQPVIQGLPDKER